MSETSGTRVFVGNLSWSVVSEDLEAEFKKVGEVVKAEVQTKADGRSKGWALVHFAKPEGAARAIEELNDVELQDRLMIVREDREPADRTTAKKPKASSSKAPSGPVGTRVFVGNLAWSVEPEQLEEIFQEKVGNVVNVDVKTKADGRSKGWAIVDFASDKDATRAIAELHDVEVEGRLMIVREDKETGARPQTKKPSKARKPARATGSGKVSETRVFVGNLSWSVTSEDLAELFKTVGTVVDAKVQTQANGRSKGWALVEFATAEHAATAIKQTNGIKFMDRDMIVREDREA